MVLWTQILANTGLRLDGERVLAEDPVADVTHARGGAVMVPLTHLRAMSAIGEDAATFLHNLLSNDVKKLPADSAQWTSFNSPKGRMLASILLWHADGGFRLAVSSDLHAAMLRRLSMYVLRAKVKLADAGEARAMLGLSCNVISECLGSVQLPVPAAPMKAMTRDDVTVIRLSPSRAIIDAPAERIGDIWARLAEHGVTPAGTQAWQWLDIQAGMPLVTEDTQDAFVAQMLNFELIGGVNFGKGCYPGQEIVARTQYLGKLKKRMYRVMAPADAAPAVGDELFAPAFDDQSVGKLVTVVPAPGGGFEALAVMQIQAAEGGNVHLRAPDGAKLRFGALPYSLEAAPAR